ncbi:RdgB/HAM1 family non-canonical purine NTP pyrophosphatase [soil metagenome]
MKIVLATSNPGKLKEFQALSMAAPQLELVLAPAGFNPEETGSTFIDNALLKAREAAALCQLPAIADDSGLTVAAMDGRPGIHSARYCEGSDGDRRHKLLQELKDVPLDKRQAAFICAIAFVDSNGEVLFTCEQEWPGHISMNESGSNGFGYDPLFIPSGLEITSAQMEPATKNEQSHRGQAWRRFLNHLATQTNPAI